MGFRSAGLFFLCERAWEPSSHWPNKKMAKNSNAESSHDGQQQPYLNRFDPLWIALFVIVVAVNVWFGIHSLTQAQRVDVTRKNAAAVLGWLSEKAPLREQKQPVSAACDDPTGSWNDCLNSVTGPEGVLANARNELEPSYPIFSDACDRKDPKSFGTIVIEKGTPKPTDPNSIAYSKMPKNQDLSEKLLLKVVVCARSFHIMPIGETSF